jgi:hypothetical protein
MDDVPAGPAILRATAYPEAGGDGVPQASAEMPIEVVPGQYTEFLLTLESTVVAVEVTPDPASVHVGETASLIATARDAAGRAVIVPPLDWSLDSGGTHVQLGSSGAVMGRSWDGAGGEAVVRATETESGVSGAATVEVEPTCLDCFGYTWCAKAGDGMGPGPNAWRPNAWCDQDGLHLPITQNGAQWVCSELVLSEALGYGEYIWRNIQGDFAAMDPCVVLGIFIYASDHEELDAMEISRWCEAGDAVSCQHAVQPADCGAVPPIRCHRFPWPGVPITVSLEWSAGKARFRTWEVATGAPVSDWTYEGAEVPEASDRTRVRLNMWLRNGQYTQPDPSAEVVVGDFEFREPSRPLEITDPVEGTCVPHHYTVRGVGTPGSRVDISIFTDAWYYQGYDIVDGNGEWHEDCVFGGFADQVHRIRAQSDDGQEHIIDVTKC